MAVTDDPYRLQRFVDAQDRRGLYAGVLAELRRGRKTTHWMWFVFPQFEGLGRSSTAREFAITCLAEACSYLEHPVLGARLVECSRLVAEAAVTSAESVFGGIDTMKLHSSMTLFARVPDADPVFAAVLDRWFGGRPDPATGALLD